jgi:hypothetical protein
MTVVDLEASKPKPGSHITVLWFLNRLVLGILILVVSLGGLAWLTHAAIESATGPETLIEAIGRLATNL